MSIHNYKPGDHVFLVTNRPAYDAFWYLKEQGHNLVGLELVVQDGPDTHGTLSVSPAHPGLEWAASRRYTGQVLQVMDVRPTLAEVALARGKEGMRVAFNTSPLDLSAYHSRPPKVGDKATVVGCQEVSFGSGYVIRVVRDGDDPDRWQLVNPLQLDVL